MEKTLGALPKVAGRLPAAVSALIAGSGIKRADLANSIGISTSTIYLKLTGSSPWKASEVAAIADFFDV